MLGLKRGDMSPRAPNEAVAGFLKRKQLEGLIERQHRRLHRRRASLGNVDAYEAIACLWTLPGSRKRIDAR